MSGVMSVAILRGVWCDEVSGYRARSLVLSHWLSCQMSGVLMSVIILPDVWWYLQLGRFRRNALSRTSTSTLCSSTWLRHLTHSTEKPCRMSSLFMVALESSFKSSAFYMLIWLDRSFPTVSNQTVSPSLTGSNRAVSLLQFCSTFSSLASWGKQ